MIWFSASWTLIILANSVGLPGFTLRVLSVVCSNRLTILPSDLVMPLMIRARVSHHLFHAGKHRVDFFFHAFQGGLLQHVRGTLDSLHDLLREAFGLSHHLSGRAQQFAIALLQLLLYLRSTPAAGPSDLD